MNTTLNRVSKELLKIWHDIDCLNLQTQQLGIDLHSFILELKEKCELGQPVVSIEEDVQSTDEEEQEEVVKEEKGEEKKTRPYGSGSRREY